MSDVLDSVFDVDRPRSDSEWRALLEGLTESLSRLLQREVVVAAFNAQSDNPAHACWAADADIRIVLSSLPLLEASGGINVTVNVRETVAISADLLLFADGIRIRGPADGDLFHFAFTADRVWVPRGWMPDEFGEFETEHQLEPPSPADG